jgi:outer membrane protein TolC
VFGNKNLNFIFKSGIIPALIALAFCLEPVSAKAKQTISLDQAVEMALAYSPTLKAVQQKLNSAKLAEKEAYTYYLPTLETQYAYKGVQDAPTTKIGGMKFEVGSENSYSWKTSVNQPLFTGFRITSMHRLAELGIDLAATDLLLNKLDVALEAKEAYLQYVKAQKSLEVAEQAVKQLEAHLKTSQDFYDVGIIPINDVLKVKVELANAQQSQVAADNAVSLAAAKLSSLIGWGVDDKVQVEDILRRHHKNITYNQALNKARVQRPELKALGIQLDQADQLIKKAQSEYYPQLGLKAGYNYLSDSPDMGDSAYYDHSGWEVQASLDWSVFEWGRTKHKVGQARADKMRLTALEKSLKDQIDLQVKQAWLFLIDSEKNIRTATTQVVQAKENYRITEERYKEQLTTNTEVLDAQTLLTQAQENYYSALTTFNLAGARLQRAMGVGLKPTKIREKK